MSGTVAAPEGITNPPIDELLEATDSKYSLVIYAAKRARQINAYYSQLGEGLLEYVGPLVETAVQEKPLSIALREINAGLLTATLLTVSCPVVYAPAMHTEMWEHPATRVNVAALRQRGAVVLDPAVGRLTGADSGAGRLPEPTEIFAVARLVLARGVAGLRADLAGRHVVVSAGGTREHLDPVRFLGNRSSGRQGVALAKTAAARGAEVTLVAANLAVPFPAGVTVVPVVSTAELRTAVLAAAPGADAIVMAAAVADFAPAVRSVVKIKKTDAAEPPSLALVRNPDILTELGADRVRPGQVVVGFAAETGDDSGGVLTHGRSKLARKGCDLLVVNEVGNGRGFEVAHNAAVILGADGSETAVPDSPKESLADVVWDLVVARLANRPAGQ